VAGLCLDLGRGEEKKQDDEGNELNFDSRFGEIEGTQPFYSDTQKSVHVKLTAGAVFILSNPSHSVACQPPVVVGEVTAHPHAVTLTYHPAVFGRLRVATADCCIHNHSKSHSQHRC